MCGLPLIAVSNVPGVVDPFGENINRRIDEERKKQQKPARKWDNFIHNESKIRVPVDKTITYEPQKTSLEMNPEAQGKLANPPKSSSSSKMWSAIKWAPTVYKMAKTGYDWYTELKKPGNMGKIVSTGVNLLNSFNNAPERVIERKEKEPHPINISVNANPHISNNSSSYSSSYGARNEAFPQYDETYQYSHRGYTYPPPETEYKLPTLHNPQASRVVRRSRKTHHRRHHRKTRR